jgi:hypothetical protein
MSGRWHKCTKAQAFFFALTGVRNMAYKRRMNKLCSLIIGAVLLAATAYSAQIGDTVQATVEVQDRVALPTQLEPTEITHITLDDGVWMISGQINILSLSQPTGTLFTAGNISVDEPSFLPAPTAAVQAERVAGSGNVIRPVALVPRVVEVDNGTQVFLVGGVFNPNTNVTAWGFITAVKIRNHVP